MIGKNLMKHSYLKKEDFYCHLNMEDINDADCVHAKRVCKDFKIKKLEEYRDTLFLAAVFENSRNMCLEIYELDPVKSLSAPGSAWQEVLKKKLK